MCWDFVAAIPNTRHSTYVSATSVMLVVTELYFASRDETYDVACGPPFVP